LLIVLFFSTTISYLSYIEGKRQITLQILSELAVTTTGRADALETYLDEKMKDAELLSMSPQIISKAGDLDRAFREKGLGSPEYAAADDIMRPIAAYYEDRLGFMDLLIVAPDGAVIFSLNKGAGYLGANLTADIHRACNLGKIFNLTSTLLAVGVSDFEYHEKYALPTAFVAAPLLMSGRIFGVVILQMRGDELYGFVSDYRGLGETGEIIVALRVGDEAEFVMPTRHDPQAAFKRRIDIRANPDLPIVRAVQGMEGIGVSIDYLGKKVLAAWQYLPSYNWGMVTKIDAVEAFAPVVKLRNSIFLITIIIMLLGVLAAYLIARSISDPIHKLHRGVELIGSGNLNYKVGIDSKDEIGQLSRAFDTMVRDLQKTTISRDYLDNIMGSMADGLIVVNPDARIATVNKATCELLGYKEEELIEKDVTLLFSEEEEEEEEEEVPFKDTKLRKLVKEGSISDYEVNFKTKDGKIIPVLLSGAVMRDIDCPGIGPVDDCKEFKKKGAHCEKIQGIVVLAKDITERKKAEELLREAYWRLESIIKGTNVGTWEWNVQTGKTVFNETWAQIIGYTLDELAPININAWEAHTHPDDLKRSAELLERHFAGELPYYDCECRMKHKDGRWVWVHDRGRLITRTADNKPLLMFGTHSDITDYKKAEEALKESEARYRGLFNNAAEGIIVADIELKRFLYCNQAICRMLGYTRDELLHLGMEGIHPKEALERVKAEFEAEARGEKSVAEVPCLRKDGTEFIASVSASVIEIGGRASLLGLFTDITARKKAEEDIRVLSRRLEFVLGTTKTGIDIIDSNFNMVYIDPEWQKVYGDYRGRKCYEYFMDRSEACPDCGVKKALDTKKTIVSEEVLVKEGDRPIQVTTMPFQDENGNWLVAEVNIDITGRKKSEKALQESEKKYRELFNSAGDPIIVHDAEGHILAANSAAIAQYGYSEAEILSMTVAMLDSAEDAPRAPERIAKIMTDGVSRFETAHLRKDGSRVLVDVSARRIGWNNAPAIMSICRDITIMKTMEAKFRLAQLGRLVAEVAHEINNPLMIISGNAQIAMMGMPDSSDLKDKLKIITEECMRAKDVTTRLLAYAKPGKGNRKSSDINQIIESVIALLEHENKLSSVIINKNYTKDLPHAVVDEKQIQEVFMNLLNNAREAMPDGGTIDIKTTFDNGFLRLSFKNSGPGIPEEYRKNLFEPFFTTKESGTGLGLPISYGVIKAHGGDILLESAAERGVVFTVLLPAEMAKQGL